MSLSSPYRDGDLFSEALWVKWPISISLPPLTARLQVAPSSVSMHHFFCRFMHYGVSATAFTARCVSWAWINKTTPFCNWAHVCVCITVFVFALKKCAAVLICMSVCVRLWTERQCFFSQVVWSELNYMAWPRASTVNSVTVQFMPEICKESKDACTHSHIHNMHQFYTDLLWKAQCCCDKEV